MMINGMTRHYYIVAHQKKVYKKMNLFSKNFKHEILKRPGPFFQSVMIKKNVLEKIDAPFDSQATPSEDWNFFIELSKINPIISYVNEPLFLWNMHADNQSLNLSKEAEALNYIVTKHYHYIRKEHGKKIIANHYRRIARVYEKIKDTNNINKFYIKAFKINPISIKNISYFLAIMIGYKWSKIIINLIRYIRGMPNV